MLLLKFEKVIAYRILNLDVLEALNIVDFVGDLENLTNAEVLDLLNLRESILKQVDTLLEHRNSLKAFG